MAKNAIVSEELAKKFATEKDSPYTRWVRSEGLDIIGAHYVPSLHTVELKPWARRGGNGVFINHEASRTSNDCYVCEIPPAKKLEPQRQLFEEMILMLDGRCSDDGVKRRRQPHHLRVEGRRAVRDPAQHLAPALQRLWPRARPLRRGHQCATGDQSLRGHRLRVRHRTRLPRPLQRRARLLQRQGRAGRSLLLQTNFVADAVNLPLISAMSAAPAAAISASTWPRAR